MVKYSRPWPTLKVFSVKDLKSQYLSKFPLSNKFLSYTVYIMSNGYT